MSPTWTNLICVGPTISVYQLKYACLPYLRFNSVLPLHDLTLLHYNVRTTLMWVGSSQPTACIHYIQTPSTESTSPLDHSVGLCVTIYLVDYPRNNQNIWTLLLGFKNGCFGFAMKPLSWLIQWCHSLSHFWLSWNSVQVGTEKVCGIWCLDWRLLSKNIYMNERTRSLPTEQRVLLLLTLLVSGVLRWGKSIKRWDKKEKNCPSKNGRAFIISQPQVLEHYSFMYNVH